MADDVRLLIGALSFALAGCVVIWGVVVFLETRAHRRRIDTDEERDDG